MYSPQVIQSKFMVQRIIILILGWVSSEPSAPSAKTKQTKTQHSVVQMDGNKNGKITSWLGWLNVSVSHYNLRAALIQIAGRRSFTRITSVASHRTNSKCTISVYRSSWSSFARPFQAVTTKYKYFHTLFIEFSGHPSAYSQQIAMVSGDKSNLFSFMYLQCHERSENHGDIEVFV